MVTKFYSDILDKTFDTEAECLDAEAAELERVRAENEKKAEIEQKQNQMSKIKKEYVKAIDDAEAALTAAYNELQVAREKYNSIINDAKKEADSILKPAEQAVYDASTARYNAIAEFNKKFGCYTKVYTGENAASEWNRLKREIGTAQRALASWFDLF